MSERKLMNRGKTDVETCILNNWSVGTVLVGHEQWSDGRGTWTTIRLTGMGESTLLARCLQHERTDASGAVIDVEKDCRDGEGVWTLRYREWMTPGKRDNHTDRSADA